MKKELSKLKEELIEGTRHELHHQRSSFSAISPKQAQAFFFVSAAIREELARSSSA